MNCAKIYPLDGHYTDGNCICGKPLTEYFNLHEMIQSYSQDSDMKYNVILDNNHLVAFNCGKIIKNDSYENLLGKYFDLYQSRFPEINHISENMREYFIDKTKGNGVEEVFWADAGLVVPKYRFDFRNLVTITKSILMESFFRTGGRLVCVNYCGSNMQKINIALGFDVIQEFGDIAFMANIDIGPQLYLYQNFGLAEIVKNLKKLLR